MSDRDEYDYDFPPAKYPGRELATFAVAVILVVAALWYGVRFLISMVM